MQYSLTGLILGNSTVKLAKIGNLTQKAVLQATRYKSFNQNLSPKCIFRDLGIHFEGSKSIPKIRFC